MMKVRDRHELWRPVTSAWTAIRDAVALHRARYIVAAAGVALLAAVAAALVIQSSQAGQPGSGGPMPAPVGTSAAPSPQPTLREAGPPAAPPDPGAEPKPEPTPSERSSPAQRDHRVVRGETLAAIGLRYDVPFEQIAADNGLVNPNWIKAGQQLMIRPKPPDVVVIQPGDTLSGIARRLGRGVPELAARNPQLTNPNRIKAGGWLHV